MNIGYKLKKNWYAFWQKYKLGAQYRNVRKLVAFLIIVWLLGSFLTIASQWMFYRELHHSASDYARYFWYVIIELVSGFDIPSDTIPLHIASQIISILMLIMGIIVVGLFTGQIISMFVHVMQRADFYPEKPAKFRFDSPILICGINQKLFNILSSLKKSPLIQNREIIIIDEDAAKIRKAEHDFDDIWYINANPCDRSVIARAIGKKDNRVIILSKDENARYSGGSSAISTALAIEAFDEKVHTVVEVANRNAVEHYQATKINECIHVSEFSLKLISQSALRPGLANVFNHLLGDKADETRRSQIFFSSALPSAFIGKSYKQIAATCAKLTTVTDFTLIGFSKYVRREEIIKYGLSTRNLNYFTQINPINAAGMHKIGDCFVKRGDKIFIHKESKLVQKDKLIYIAEHPVSFEQALGDL